MRPSRARRSRCRRRQGEDRHHLRRRRDVEPGLADEAVLLGAEADDDVAQRPVVDVEHAPPGDVVRVEAQLVALVEVVVEHRREQVVGRRHGVEVAGQVEVEQLHRDDLAVATAGGAALDAERRPHRRLADRDDGALADVAHRLAEADRRRRLALAERRRRDRRDHDVLRRGVARPAPRSPAGAPWPGSSRRARGGARRCPSRRRSPAAVSGVAALAIARSDGNATCSTIRDRSAAWNTQAVPDSAREWFTMSQRRATERQRGSGQQRPAWPGNAMTAHRRDRRRHRRQLPRRSPRPARVDRHRARRQGPAAQPGRLDRPRLELHLPHRPQQGDGAADAGEPAPVRRARGQHDVRRASRSPAPRSGWRSSAGG